MPCFINLSDVLYNLPDGNKLFSDVSYVFSNNKKVAVIGDNGVGKTTLLKIITGQLKPSFGNVGINCCFSFLEQDISNLKGSVASVLGVERILNAIELIEKIQIILKTCLKL